MWVALSLCDQLFDPPQLKQLMSFSTLASFFALACFLITFGLFVQLFSFGRHLVIVTSWTVSNRKVIISTRNLPPHQLCGSCSCYLVLVKGFLCFYQKRINATALCSFRQAVIRCRGSPSRQYLSLRHFLLTSWKENMCCVHNFVHNYLVFVVFMHWCASVLHVWLKI